MSDYKSSPLWLKAMELAEEIFRVTQSKADEPRLRAQNFYNHDAEEVAYSIALAEGHVTTPHDYLRYLSSAQGRLFRFETRLLLDVRRNYLQQADVDAALKLCDELGKLLSAKTDELANERNLRLNRQNRPHDSRGND